LAIEKNADLVILDDFAARKIAIAIAVRLSPHGIIYFLQATLINKSQATFSVD